MVTFMKRRKIAGIPSTKGCISGTRSLALDFKMARGLTACQARGARKMLNWSVRELAKRSNVSDSSIRRMEEGFGVPENVSLDLRTKMQEYFEGRGFVFKWDEHLGIGIFWNRTGRRDRRMGTERRQGPT